VIVKLGGSGSIGDVNTSQRTWRGRLRLEAIRRWADVVVVLTELMKKEALSAGVPENRIHMFNNGIDSSLYVFEQTKDEAKQVLGLDGKMIILFIGRLDPVKSLSTVLNALALSLDQLHVLHLLIVGDGPERTILEKKVRDLQIDSKVSFMGNQKDVRLFLCAADVFVLPSKTEGISNALLEAMSAQIPCLATPVGGNLEVLDGGKYGLLVPVGDVQAWADALVKAGSDSEWRAALGGTAHERILAQYDFNVVGRQYEHLYYELMGQVAPFGNEYGGKS
jgi:glycosyltransferase involved in cell wall biosynthesis